MSVCLSFRKVSGKYKFLVKIPHITYFVCQSFYKLFYIGVSSFSIWHPIITTEHLIYNLLSVCHFLFFATFECFHPCLDVFIVTQCSTNWQKFTFIDNAYLIFLFNSIVTYSYIKVTGWFLFKLKLVRAKIKNLKIYMFLIFKNIYLPC